MFRNYIKIAWRNLLKNKVFSFLNIFGLAVGLATCLLLTLYIIDEINYDTHHKDGNKIYRIAYESIGNAKMSSVSAPLASGFKEEFPEVKETTRLLKFPNIDKFLLQNEKNNEQFYETNGYYVDSTFFKVLTYNFKYGDASTALNNPNTVVLSENVSNKLFGDINPVNKTINIEISEGKSLYTVTGVFKKGRAKSHIDANLLISMQNTEMGGWVNRQKNWATNNLFHTYIKLKKESSVESIEKKLSDFIEQKVGPELAAFNGNRRYFLQSLLDIHLKSDFNFEISPNSSMTYIYIFSAIAAFLLLIACINFMNLSTARSEKRAKEVGMRKVLGAKKKGLIFQFLGESMLLSIMALVLALLLVMLFLPVFNNITQKDLQFFQNPEIIFWIIGLALFTGLLSGIYPAFYLSSFKPIKVLKGTLVNSISAKAIRKGLVIFQFTISACLILLAGVIWQQMEFIKNQDIGFNKNQQLLIPFLSEAAADNYSTFKNEILKNPNVLSATAGNINPAYQMVFSDGSFFAEGKTIENSVWTRLAYIKEDYLETLGYELLYGRVFSDNEKDDYSSTVLNETAVKNLGYKPKDAVGHKIYFVWNEVKYESEIIGVVKDFNFQSLHEPIGPFGFRAHTGRPNFFITTIREGNFKNVIADIKTKWTEINPEAPFEFSFLDESFDRNYASEQRTSRVIFSFMLIAIFIACLGLFGLASFTTEQRQKEVGIRRVLGASVMAITGMHLKDFLKLVLIAMLIASPLSYYLGNKWLQDFAYRIDIGWQLFIGAALVALLVALITVSFQVVKAAIANPVKSLRTE